jgi:uncharacterized protein YndB with AHSA1/START domain
MSTREIGHEVLINASSGGLYEAVTDMKKHAHRWSTDARGQSEVGKTLEFRFGGLVPSP